MPLRLLILTLLFALAGCGDDRSGSPAGKLPADTLVRLSESDVKGLDPQLVSDLSSQRVGMDLHAGLTRYDGSGTPRPALAERWTVSADGLDWTFHLRSKLTFSDGAPIDATHFARGYARIQDPKAASPHGGLFAAIADVSAPDPLIVRVRLHAPFPQLPALLAHPAMAALPFHRIDAEGERWTAERPLVSSGPYRLTGWRLNEAMLLERNPGWSGPPAATAKVQWRPIDNVLTQMRTMLAGEADVAPDFPPQRTNAMRREHGALTHVRSQLGTYYYAFNTRRPPFDDARVRRALAMTVERDWLVSMVGAGNAPAWGVVPPALRGGAALRPSWAGWPREQRLAEARRLLAEAGYGPKRPLKFTIRFNSSAEHRRVSVALAAMWRPLEVEASLLNSESALHFDALRRSDFDLARSGWIADLPAPENFLSVHTKAAGATNYSGYASPAYEALLARAAMLADPAARAAAMREAEAKLSEDAPVLPLYFYVSRALVGPRVTGWQDNDANIHPSDTLALKGR